MTPHRTADATVGSVLRRGIPVCAATTSIADAAKAMTEARSSTIVVEVAGGAHAVVTDGDLRRRVVATGLTTDAPVSSIASSPAVTVGADVAVPDAAVVALSAGVGRLLVIDDGGTLLGVVDETDLVSPRLRAGTVLRADVERAADAEALVAACARLPSVVVSLTESRARTSDVTMIRSVVAAAAVRRAAELLGDDASTWLVSGSVARRESMPSSDIETARVVPDHVRGAELVGEGADRTSDVGTRVHALLDRCGIRADTNNATAISRRFVRSRAEWTAAVEGWIADPYEDTGLVMMSLALDADPVVPGGWSPAAVARTALADAPRTRKLMLREATENGPRVTLRDRMFRRAEVVDVKAGILSSIVDIARWASVSAGGHDRSTLSRLASGASAGTLSGDDASVLAESFEVVQRIRLRHHCEALRAGTTPDDLVRVSDLTPLDRSLLGTAAREVAGVRRASAYLAG